ncbi:hypothetical protein [Muricoccus radiodurans]|uniref:hypothetical protein n=1 Tax=Muricoccus radiodurans TaxID=2231721 RepID=UPI003CEEFABF
MEWIGAGRERAKAHILDLEDRIARHEAALQVFEATGFADGLLVGSEVVKALKLSLRLSRSTFEQMERSHWLSLTSDARASS